MTTGLVIGRFQPFHMGHLFLIEDLAKKVDKIVICIGSTQEIGTNENPYTYGERRAMIDATLSFTEIKYKIIGVDDSPEDDTAWANNILKLAGKIDVLHTGNPHVRDIFKKQGIKVEDIKRYKAYRGTDIRRFMREEQDISTFVPLEVLGFIQ